MREFEDEKFQNAMMDFVRGIDFLIAVQKKQIVKNIQFRGIGSQVAKAWGLYQEGREKNDQQLIRNANLLLENTAKEAETIGEKGK